MAQVAASTGRAGSHALTTLSTTVLGRSAALLLSLIVARVLSPFQVGTLGLAVLIVGLITLLASFPESAAIYLQPTENHSEPALAGAITSLVGTAILCATVRLALDPIAAVIGGSSDGAETIRGLAMLLLWQPILDALASYPRILLRRRLDLAYVAGIQLFGTLLFSASAAVMLGLGLGPASVVWGQLLGTAIATALFWQRCLIRGEVRGRGWPTTTTWSALAGDSLRLMSGGVGGYLTERLDNLLVAGILGPTSASFYMVAWNIARIPVNTLSQVVYNVVIPTAAACRADAGRLSRALRDTLRFAALPISLAGTMLFFFGPILVEGILGSKWRPLAPVLRVMAFTILNSPVQFATGVLLIVSHRAHVIGLATATHLTLQVLLIPQLSARYGVAGAAYADLLGTTLVTAVLVVGVILGSDPAHWLSLRAVGTPAVAAALSAATAAAIVPGAQSSAGWAVVAILTTLLLFPVLMRLLGDHDSVKGLASHVYQWVGNLGTLLHRSG